MRSISSTVRKFLPVGEDEEEVEGSLVLPPVRRRRKAGTRPELSAETRVRMSLSVKRHERATGIRAQRIREAMADPHKWAQRNAAIRVSPSLTLQHTLVCVSFLS